MAIEGATWRRREDRSSWSNDGTSARRRDRRQFADFIANHLVELQSADKCQAARMEMLEKDVRGLVESIAQIQNFLLAQSNIAPHSMQHMPMTGAEYYVEVPVIKYVEKVIEVPKFVYAESKSGTSKLSSASSTEQKVVAHKGTECCISDYSLSKEEEQDVLQAGIWEPLGPSCVLSVGDTLRVEEEIGSNNASAYLAKGLQGRVSKLDADGDAMIMFPSMTWDDTRLQWIGKDRFKKLSVRQKMDVT